MLKSGSSKRLNRRKSPSHYRKLPISSYLTPAKHCVNILTSQPKSPPVISTQRRAYIWARPNQKPQSNPPPSSKSPELSAPRSEVWFRNEHSETNPPRNTHYLYSNPLSKQYDHISESQFLPAVVENWTAILPPSAKPRTSPLHPVLSASTDEASYSSLHIMLDYMAPDIVALLANQKNPETRWKHLSACLTLFPPPKSPQYEAFNREYSDQLLFFEDGLAKSIRREFLTHFPHDLFQQPHFTLFPSIFTAFVQNIALRRQQQHHINKNDGSLHDNSKSAQINHKSQSSPTNPSPDPNQHPTTPPDRSIHSPQGHSPKAFAAMLRHLISIKSNEYHTIDRLTGTIWDFTGPTGNLLLSPDQQRQLLEEFCQQTAFPPDIFVPRWVEANSPHLTHQQQSLILENDLFVLGSYFDREKAKVKINQRLHSKPSTSSQSNQSSQSSSQRSDHQTTQTHNLHQSKKTDHIDESQRLDQVSCHNDSFLDIYSRKKGIPLADIITTLNQPPHYAHMETFTKTNPITPLPAPINFPASCLDPMRPIYGVQLSKSHYPPLVASYPDFYRSLKALPPSPKHISLLQQACSRTFSQKSNLRPFSILDTAPSRFKRGLGFFFEQSLQEFITEGLKGAKMMNFQVYHISHYFHGKPIPMTDLLDLTSFQYLRFSQSIFTNRAISSLYPAEIFSGAFMVERYPSPANHCVALDKDGKEKQLYPTPFNHNAYFKLYQSHDLFARFTTSTAPPVSIRAQTFPFEDRNPSAQSTNNTKSKPSTSPVDWLMAKYSEKYALQFSEPFMDEAFMRQNDHTSKDQTLQVLTITASKTERTLQKEGTWLHEYYNSMFAEPVHSNLSTKYAEVYKLHNPQNDYRFKPNFRKMMHILLTYILPTLHAQLKHQNPDAIPQAFCVPVIVDVEGSDKIMLNFERKTATTTPEQAEVERSRHTHKYTPRSAKKSDTINTSHASRHSHSQGFTQNENNHEMQMQQSDENSNLSSNFKCTIQFEEVKSQYDPRFIAQNTNEALWSNVYIAHRILSFLREIPLFSDYLADVTIDLHSTPIILAFSQRGTDLQFSPHSFNKQPILNNPLNTSPELSPSVLRESPEIIPVDPGPLVQQTLWHTQHITTIQHPPYPLSPPSPRPLHTITFNPDFLPNDIQEYYLDLYLNHHYEPLPDAISNILAEARRFPSSYLLPSLKAVSHSSGRSDNASTTPFRENKTFKPFKGKMAVRPTDKQVLPGISLKKPQGAKPTGPKGSANYYPPPKLRF